MTKKEYLKPEMVVVAMKQRTTILTASIVSISTSGLDDDALILPTGDDPVTGNIFNDAW